MAEMIRQTKEMMAGILGDCEIANYFIIDELNPDAWGFDGISMTVRRAGK
jgi:4-oxalocrotonate tautomerase